MGCGRAEGLIPDMGEREQKRAKKTESKECVAEGGEEKIYNHLVYIFFTPSYEIASHLWDESQNS